MKGNAMRTRSLRIALVVSSLAIGMPAHALTCYQIWDNRDELAYQSPLPPFELAGATFERSMNNLRARHGQLMFFDTPTCVVLGNATYWVPGKPPQDAAALLPDRGSPSKRGGIAASPVSAAPGAPAAGAPAAGAPAGGAAGAARAYR
jgi:hypothetical protein